MFTEIFSTQGIFIGSVEQTSYEFHARVKIGIDNQNGG